MMDLFLKDDINGISINGIIFKLILIKIIILYLKWASFLINKYNNPENISGNKMLNTITISTKKKKDRNLFEANR